ncbi:MAG: glutathione S-transferase N-terminal domain-containing protein, partial [Albidovulum sp.]|nr:glutathione S-transferase N-terminal domain-containing protein [Albidovulum sp.]
MMPVLWGRASSVNVQKVLWTLAELEIEFERIDAGWTYGRTNTEDFAAMNPNRLIPVWQEEGLTLWESHAIVRHLAARRPKIIGHGPIADQW